MRGLKMKTPRLLPVVLVSVVASLTLTAAPRAQNVAVPVIISTDTSTGLQNGWRSGVSDIDDGLAIAMALSFPEAIDVRGIVVTWGNNLMEPEFAVAERVVQGMGADVPVLHGASRGLPVYPVVDYDGTTVNSACLNEGVEFMASELTESATPITMIAIGPLTDLACLAMNYPQLLDKIDRVVALMGRNPNEAFDINGHYLSDLNLVVDPIAGKYLIDQTSLRFTFMTFPLSSSALVPRSDREILCQSALPLASQFLCPAVVPWIDQWNRTFAEDGFHPWDQNTIYDLVDPEAFQCAPATYELVDCGDGQCAGHDPNDPDRLSTETVQLWLTPTEERTRIEACTAYAPGGKDAFLNAIFEFAR
jgi:pyrimidine-specific ribonucleoside hydrolase